MIAARYTLQIHVPEDVEPVDVIGQLEMKMSVLLKETEENLTDLLPEGWTATIEAKE